ncbi:MAG: hypothetical protein PVJ57_06000 [Phycisphaerae bacterium]|jgi:exo-beta-1,3-glucanase (GH17 family)
MYIPTRSSTGGQWLILAVVVSGFVVVGCSPVKTDSDTDGDGVGDIIDACLDTPGCAVVDENGCPIDSDGDGTYDGCGELPGTTIRVGDDPLLGLAYGAFRQHERPEGLQPTLEEIREDLEILKAILSSPPRIRIYSATRGSGFAATEAAGRGFQVTLGAWIGKDAEANREEIRALINIANSYPLAAAIVGNEAIWRKDVSPDELAGMILQVKEALPEGVLVGTAELSETWMTEEAKVVADASEVLLVHVHPYWDKESVEQAAAAVFDRYDDVAQAYPSKVVIIGETGWPSAGQIEGKAVPSPDYQEAFMVDFAKRNAERRIATFFFSAFDEPWKGAGERPPDEAIASAGYGGNPIEGDTGAHWGVLRWNRTVKSNLADQFATVPEPPCHTREFVVFTQGTLSPGHGMGVDSSSGRGDWVVTSEYLRLDYPAGQCWGSVFVTVGEPAAEVPRPDFEDLSEFGWVAFDVRGEMGGETLEVAVKDNQAADDGTEPKVRVVGLETAWRSVAIPLDNFDGVDLTRVCVPVSFNLVGMNAQTVFVQNVRYVPVECPVTSELAVTRVARPATAEGDVFVDGCMGRWYAMGLDTSEGVHDWAETVNGALCLSYPGGQRWGAMSIVVQEQTVQRPRPHYQDFSSYGRLVFEARGDVGGESFEVGAKDRYAPDTGQETKVTVGPLTSTWEYFSIPIDEFVGTEFGELYVPFEAVFEGSTGRTVFIRNIRYGP